MLEPIFARLGGTIEEAEPATTANRDDNTGDADDKPEADKAETPADTAADPTDIAASLAAEVEVVRAESRLGGKGNCRPFHYSSPVRGTCYVKMNERCRGPGPVELALALADEVTEKRALRSRHCVRVVPVEAVCFAGLDEIKEGAAPLLATHFPADAASGSAEAVSVSVDVQAKSAPKLDRLDIINAIMSHIKVPPHKVDLTSPQRTVLVFMVRSAACLAVLTRGLKHESVKNLNFRRLAGIDEERVLPPGDKRGEAGEGAMANLADKANEEAKPAETVAAKADEG